MRQQIRKNVFETNSSSVHTITISKKNDTELVIPKTLEFEFNNYGWEVSELNTPVEKASYLISAICSIYGECELEMYENQIKETLEKRGCTAIFGEAHRSYYIDHPNLEDFVNILLYDEKILLEYLFGDATVYTYNDNMDVSETFFYEKMDKKKNNEETYISFRKGN